MVKKVNIGAVKGETPRKIFYFNKLDAPDQVESATPERAFFGDDGPLKSLLKKASPVAEEAPVDPYTSPEASTRPTTSRGKSRPSPEEFASYVVPSPERGSSSPVEGKVLVFDDDDDKAINFMESAESGEDESKGEDSWNTNEEEVVAIGCWLFGSALSV